MPDSDADETTATAASDDDSDVTRRWLIRAVVGLGLGIPVVVEGATLVGLVESWLFGDGEGDDAAASTTTASEPATVVGDDLLPTTDRAETLADATVYARDDGWRFELAVDVENSGDRPYELRLGTVTTQDGARVDGDAATDRLAVGESATLSASYDLPDGETPATMAVVGVEYVDGGGERFFQQTVRFGNIPVRG
ncbi:hypothetical protein [Halobacterium jilantaiense]|uniref:DUF4352 domain-containing protein n=1 Tax=Halobacterium jilantaiense TaxID=355548 RepID=A0A1I0PXI4_9EURY|nr:hypothetical protein [Halobacterium jilantaiense]SEW19159.1 hypothetical protein SAMN04487945_2061 [Halobacterium jilantaiense]